MTLKNKIKRILTGLTLPQEYICLQSNRLQDGLSVILFTDEKQFSLDVTSSHLFVGYKPLILALPFKVSNNSYQIIKNRNQILLNFENAGSIKPKILARLVLKKLEEKILDEDVVLFYEGMWGNHSFLNSIHRQVNQLLEKWREQSPNNVGLPGNLVEQVRIAYSVPRTISIITVSDGNLMNMFPTDLHGSIGEKFYTGSLRTGGLANNQIEKYDRIAISEVEPSFYKQAYFLGKNHMQELQPENKFSLHSMRSKNFNFPLPVAATSYQELKRVNWFDVGIHRIHIYEVLHRQIIQDSKESLTHIHQYYAQWRLDHRLVTNMLLR